MKTIPVILLLLVACPVVFSQDTIVTKNKPELNGYIKNLQTLRFDKNFDQLITGNLIHNRVNIKWKPSTKLHAAAEIRNRLFWGDEIQSTPGFTSRLRNENEVVNLSALWISKNNFVLHTNVERLWMEYRGTKWNLRAGRQRINWGIATTWNPGDIFNTYNFLDFDYEERPGSDAVKYQYLFNDFSHLEIAVSPSGKKNRTIAATRYYINRWGYDIQLISGIYQNKFTIGAGWAGSIGDMGFKGEGQFYAGNKDSAGLFNISVEFDYVFKDGWYVNGAALYNHNGINEPVSDWSKISFQFSPVNLMPARWNMILTSAKEFTPLLNGRIGMVYSPNMNLFILLPSIQYNLAANLDADLVWQSFFLELQNTFQAAGHSVFLRLKWSF